MQLLTVLRMGQVGNSSTAHQWSLIAVFLGLIREKLWYGEGGMQGLRTIKEPRQSLTTFEETIQLLMRVSTLPKRASISTHILH